MTVPSRYQPTDLPILGNVCIAQITQSRIKRQIVNDGLKAHNVPKALYVQTARPENAFQRATAALAGRKFPVPGEPTLTARWLIRDVYTDAQIMVRHLVREIRDPGNKRLNYDTIAKFSLSRGTTAMILPTEVESELESWERELVAAADAEVLDLFQTDVYYVTARALHSLLAKTYTLANASQISGGTYFVPRGNEDIVNSVYSVLQEAYTEAGATVVTAVIPLVDTEDQRVTVSRALNGSITSDLLNLSRELEQARAADGEVSDRRMATFTARAHAIGQRISEYEDLVAATGDHIQIARDLVKESLARLLTS